MSTRPFWLNRIHAAWQQAPICWLAGVRRAGKTTLCQSLTEATFLNCDLPEVAAQLADPVRFFRQLATPRLVLDEVHQLPDPSRILKIAADEFPHLRVVATGSSTVAATDKFSDSLTGRKRLVHLVPVLAAELAAFGRPDLDLRMLRGGLPQALLATDHPRPFYGEWLDSYFARDVRELFHVEKRAAFLTLFEALLRQSGGMFETTSLARVAGVSRPTVMNYLNVLEVTHAITLVRPWSGGRSDRELVQAPKAYGFDTGFVCHARGMRDLRPEDRGSLLEHLVLETLQSLPDLPRTHYWRDKQRHEVDFILPFDRDRVDAIEVKWNPDAFEPKNLKVFRGFYPQGRNWVVSGQSAPPFTRSVAGMEVTFVGMEALGEVVA